MTAQIGSTAPWPGRCSITGDSNGIGTNAQFASLYGVVADDQNNLEATDAGNREVRKVTSAGAVTTFAGSYVQGGAGSADGVGNQAQFNDPCGVAVDAAGNVYVSDQGNNTVNMIYLGREREHFGRDAVTRRNQR